MGPPNGPKRLVGLVLVSFVLATLPAEGATWVVNRLTDRAPASGGEGSGLVGDLRYAITHARSGDTVTFAVAGTIQPAAFLPQVTQSIRVTGPGAPRLILRGGLTVSAGATVVVSGITITGGVGNGGGIFNGGTLTLDDVVVTGNRAGDPTNGGGTGAGIWNYLGATLTLNRSTVSNNSAVGNNFYNPSRGGGIANDGRLTLNNSTVSGNSANYGFGGGIHNTGTLTLQSSTVAGNVATGGGAGVADRGAFTTRNSIVAGNEGTDLSGDLTSLGHNLFGSGGSGFGYTDLVAVDPLLGPLENNGGLTPTMAPLPGSPAIDWIAGTPPHDFPGADQRGIARPQGARADIGAVEVVPEGPTVDTSTTVASATGTFGQTVALRATLTRADTDVPLPGRVLSFKVAGSAVGSGTTDVSGTARVNVAVSESLGVGLKAITAAYAGGAAFSGSSGSSTLTVQRGQTTLSVASVTVPAGGTAALKATLRRAVDRHALAGRTVQFRVDGRSIGTARTNGAGLASIAYAVPPATSSGGHVVTASFAGGGYYAGSSGRGTLRVVDGPAVDVIVNGSDGPLHLAPGDPLRVELSFQSGRGPAVEPGEVYVAVWTAGAWWWLDAAGSFVPAVTRVYAGAVPSFGPVTVLDLPSGSLPRGSHLWLMIVDGDSDGSPDGHFYDFVETIVP